LRIHSGERPFICNREECNAKFKTSGHLKDHMKIHYDIKYFIIFKHIDPTNVTFALKNTLVHVHLRYINVHILEKNHIDALIKDVVKFSQKKEI
jgi:uncharacterized Zn-finger protein